MLINTHVRTLIAVLIIALFSQGLFAALLPCAAMTEVSSSSFQSPVNQTLDRQSSMMMDHSQMDHSMPMDCCQSMDENSCQDCQCVSLIGSAALHAIQYIKVDYTASNFQFFTPLLADSLPVSLFRPPIFS